MMFLIAQQSLSFDSPFGDLGSAILFVLAVAVIAWMILRERRVLGTFWQGVFLLTRVTALIAIFWMLLQPARIKETNNQSTQSIAILVDRSPSMDVSDTLITAEMLAWKALTDEESVNPGLVSMDQSLLHTGHLNQLCQQYHNAVLQHASTQTLQSLVTHLTSEVSRTGELLSGLTQLDGDSATSEIAGDVLATFRGQIDGFVRHKLTAPSDDHENRDAAQELAEFETFSTSIGQLHDQLKRLQRVYLQSQVAVTPVSSSQLAAAPTRRELIANCLDRLEASTLEKLPGYVQVSRVSFDEAPEQLIEPVSWSESLLNRQAGEKASVFRPISLQQELNDSDTARTDLSAALESLQREMLTRRFRFAILITEGRHNQDSKLLPGDIAKQLDGLPIYTVPIGNSASRRDVILHRISAPPTVVQGDQAVIRAIVSAYDCAGETVTVNLVKLGQVVQSQSFEVAAAEMDHRVSFQVPTEVLGRSEYEVNVEQVADEVTTKNNAVAVSVEVIRDKLRILLADNYPRWEFRYLQQLFRRDSHVEHDEALFQPRLQLTGDLALNGGGLPRTLETWATYDVVILGDLMLEQLNSEQQAQLNTYVSERGGKVILIGGSEQMPQSFADFPLARLLPVTRGPTMLNPASSYAVELTAEGETHPAMLIADSLHESRELWHQIYTKIPLTSMSNYHQLKPSARSLADVKLLPAGQASIEASQLSGLATIGSYVSWQRVGKGHVVFLASPSSYTLRFRQGDKYHHRFWGQLLRWLTAADLSTGTELVRMQTDKTRYSRGEDVTVTVRLADTSGQPVRAADAHVHAKSDDDIVASIPLQEDEKVPGLYRAVFEKLRAGVYHIEPEGPLVASLLSQQDASKTKVDTLIAVEELLNTEMINTELNLPLLEQISSTTGGQVISPLAIPELFRMTNFDPEVTTQVETIPLWNSWPLLWLIAGCLSFEWLVRKQKGLL